MTDERKTDETGDEAGLDTQLDDAHGGGAPAPLEEPTDAEATDPEVARAEVVEPGAPAPAAVALEETDALEGPLSADAEITAPLEAPRVPGDAVTLDDAPLDADEPDTEGAPEQAAETGLPYVEPAPERAGRRVAPGMRIATRLAAGSIAAAVLPALVAAAGLVLVPEEAPPAPGPEIPAALPNELADAERSLDALEAELRTLDARRLELEQTALEAALAEATPRLMQRVAEARDARRAAGATGKALKEPFTHEELSPALSALGVAKGGPRWIVGRDGAVIAPEGAAPPAGVELAAEGDDNAALAVVVPRDGGGRALVARHCIAKEALCLVEERALPPLPADAGAARAGLGKARATLTALARPAAPAAPGAALAPSRLRLLLAGGALALAVLLGLLLARRLRAQLSTPLTTLEGRLRLLAAGRVSERAPLSRPAEIEALEDAVDALAETLGHLERLEEEDARRARRLFALADVVGEAARGQLFLRAPPADDVAEEALNDALNRLLEAFERQVVRMKSHLLVLARDTEVPDDTSPVAPAGEEGRVQALQRRIQGLRPVASLLGDISQRLSGLAKLPPSEGRVPGELARLAEAIGQRAKTAHGLFDALEAETARLRDGAAPDGQGLAPEQRRALEQLAKDLAALSVDDTLPTLVDSLRGLDEGDIASRLATQG